MCCLVKALFSSLLLFRYHQMFPFVFHMPFFPSQDSHLSCTLPPLCFKLFSFTKVAILLLIKTKNAVLCFCHFGLDLQWLCMLFSFPFANVHQFLTVTYVWRWRSGRFKKFTSAFIIEILLLDCIRKKKKSLVENSVCSRVISV